MPFSEQESVTIKRLEVAIRNSDMELLKDAAYKLHEKLHEGTRFEMLQELSQILAYVSDSEIPVEIKEILCPTIEEILDKETAPQNNVAPSVNSAQSEVPVEQTSFEFVESDQKTESEELESQNQIPDIAPEQPSIYRESPVLEEKNIASQNTEPVVEIPQAIQENTFSQVDERNDVKEEPYNEPVINQEKSVEIYEPTYSNDSNYNKEDTSYSDNSQEQDRISAYQEQFSSSNNYKTNIGGYSTEDIVNNIQEEVSGTAQNIQEHKDIEEPEEINNSVQEHYSKENTYEENQYQDNKEVDSRMTVFYFDKKSTPTSSLTNQIDELSSVIDKVDTDIYDFEKLLKAIKSKNGHVQIVTTTQSIKLSEFLVQENISFNIPFVTNTTSENANFEIIPMYGLSNIFKCQNCGSKILSYSFNNKVLSVKCSNCSDVMYPEIYSEDKNINPYYWQRAFGALAGSKTWILFNVPSEDGVIKDFIKTVFQNSAPEKIYLFPENNYYENFFSKTNPNCEIITYQTQEKMTVDLSYGENAIQAFV